MRLLVCGSRQWHDREPIEQLIRDRRDESESRGEPFVLIHGHCPDGADWIANRIALDLGMTPGVDLIQEPAQWKRYGKAAGPVRNQKMLDDHKPDEVHAFRNGVKSNGTDGMVKLSRKAGVPTHVHVQHATPDA